MAKRYKVLGVKVEGSEEVAPFVDEQGAKWDAGSEVSDKQVSDDFAAKAVERGELEALPEGDTNA